MIDSRSNIMYSFNERMLHTSSIPNSVLRAGCCSARITYYTWVMGEAQTYSKILSRLESFSAVICVRPL